MIVFLRRLGCNYLKVRTEYTKTPGQAQGQFDLKLEIRTQQLHHNPKWNSDLKNWNQFFLLECRPHTNEDCLLCKRTCIGLKMTQIIEFLYFG